MTPPGGISTLLPLSLLTAAAVGSCSPEPVRPEPAHGESVLEQVVRIEPQLQTSIPEVDRWCDRIPELERHRIDVGGAELYVEMKVGVNPWF